jgi:hypothetical protein
LFINCGLFVVIIVSEDVGNILLFFQIFNVVVELVFDVRINPFIDPEYDE